MNITGQEREELQDALLSAFPRRSQLTQFVSFQFNKNLDVIAGGDTLADVVFNLIGWAEADGRLDELIVKAREQNPATPSYAPLLRQKAWLPTYLQPKKWRR